MTDKKNKGEDQAARKDPRQDRLKLALRENLKRRKSQARERSRAGAPSNDHEIPLEGEAGDKTGRDKPGQ